ncbi:MAG: zinc ribbon domain-containing protein [Asgard group archaeon]|nr:zinc ribbon domain-containing protein [Asgard group archaeon]
MAISFEIIGLIIFLVIIVAVIVYIIIKFIQQPKGSTSVYDAPSMNNLPPKRKRKEEYKVSKDTQIISPNEETRIEFCPYCGEKIKDVNEKFCPFCGKKLQDM